MEHVFHKYLQNKSNLSDEEIATVISYGTLKKLRKREHLLKEGSVSRHRAFVCKGCSRIYRVSSNGNEHILRFATETWWIGDQESYTTEQPSKSNIDMLEDTILLVWTKADMERLRKEIAPYNSFLENLMTKSLQASHNRIYASISLSAEEKYNDFIHTYPDLSNRVPLHMIASYLGVTRETLSRIRHKELYKS